MLTKLVNWLMRIKSLSIKNFRGIEELKLDFNSLEPIIFIGVNGVGKSSILDCISKLIKFWAEQIIYSEENQANSFKVTDIKNGFKVSKNSIKIIINSQEGEISVHSTLIDPQIGNLNKPILSIEPIIEDFRNKLTKSTQVNFPVAIYYPVNRSVVDFSIESSQDFEFDQAHAYKNAVSSKNINFKDFFEWFRNREDLEAEFLRDNATYQDGQLEAVRKAITSILPDFSYLRVRRSPLRMTVEKQNQELIINQLSDGEKCLLALVGDLARRLAIANPGLEDPLQGTGVVLIDEIELHLHPSWQYEIIPALTRTFPNCQFIVTTHSPIVLSQVKPEGIFCLEKDKDGKVIAYHPDSSYGRDVNQIVEDLMGVPSRPVQFQQKILELFRLIDAGDLDGAKQKREELANEMGADKPELVKANVSIRRKEILNK
jgi:predicted ATP-binding protein involved in virulence